MAAVGHRDVVDQPEIVDVDRNFRVIDFLDRLDDRRLQVAARLGRRWLGRFGRQKSFEVIALALECLAYTALGDFVGLIGRGSHDRFDTCLGRLVDRIDGLCLDRTLLVHPNIFLTRSTPRTNAATSLSSL